MTERVAVIADIHGIVAAALGGLSRRDPLACSPVQIAGCVSGAVAVNAMFALSAVVPDSDAADVVVPDENAADVVVPDAGAAGCDGTRTAGGSAPSR